jgi:hypothetical protein
MLIEPIFSPPRTASTSFWSSGPTTWPNTVCLPSSQSGRHVGDEELAAVGAGAGIGHRQDAAAMAQGGHDLVLEAVARATGAGARAGSRPGS